MINREIKIFLTAISFFTRIPVPKFDFKEEYLTQCCRYFSLIGLIVGLGSYFAFNLTFEYIGLKPAIITALTVAVIMTGAFHEDGLADMADGFGGGWTKEKKLEIMKDSRLGTYGTVTLILLFAFKISLYHELIRVNQLPILLLFFLATHSLSRMAAASLMLTMPYVQETDKSKSKPVATLNFGSFMLLTTVAVAPLGFMPAQFFYVFIPLSILIGFMKFFLTKQIGGITGDCLGGCQQIGELVCVASFVVISKNLIM